MFALMITVAALAALSSTASVLQKRANTTFFNPTQGGGSFIDDAGNGFGEPLNVIISGTSSPAVLTDEGFIQYAQAIGFSPECLGMQNGGPEAANLGDGNGPLNQTLELRDNIGNTAFGTCIEDLIGGNHLRLYRQNGTLANSGALFLAVSTELGLLENHTIAFDGYNRGRDDLVQGAAGSRTFNGTVYNTVVQNLTGVMPSGAAGINHNISIDGNAFLLTVNIM